MPNLQKIVIVAEDEPLVRMLAADILTDAGYLVVEAAHAEAALSAIKAHHGEVLALFTDVHMPGEYSGLELARLVHAQWPRVAIVVTSGHPDLIGGDVPTGGLFVTKPYDTTQIVAHLEVLTGRKA